MIYKYDEIIARKSAEIYLNLKSKVLSIDTNDIFIAATAVVNNIRLCTLNTKHFESIKNLKLINHKELK
jgi:predicted nucleic acid-binding protein